MRDTQVIQKIVSVMSFDELTAFASYIMAIIKFVRPTSCSFPLMQGQFFIL